MNSDTKPFVLSPGILIITYNNLLGRSPRRSLGDYGFGDYGFAELFNNNELYTK